MRQPFDVSLLPLLSPSHSSPSLQFSNSKPSTGLVYCNRGKSKPHSSPRWLCCSSSHPQPMPASGAAHPLFPQTFPMRSALAFTSQPIVTAQGHRPDQAKALPLPQPLSTPIALFSFFPVTYPLPCPRYFSDHLLSFPFSHLFESTHWGQEQPSHGRSLWMLSGLSGQPRAFPGHLEQGLKCGFGNG